MALFHFTDCGELQYVLELILLIGQKEPNFSGALWEVAERVHQPPWVLLKPACPVGVTALLGSNRVGWAKPASWSPSL